MLTGAMKARYLRYKSLIDAENAKYPALSAHPYLLPSVLAHESKFQAGITSPKNTNGTVDQGIGQLNSQYHSATIAYNPSLAIPTAAAILNQGLTQCGSIQGALQTYNGGHCGAATTAGYISGVQSFFPDFGGGSASSSAGSSNLSGSAGRSAANATGSAIKSGATALFGQKSTMEEILFALAGIGLLVVAFTKLS